MSDIFKVGEVAIGQNFVRATERNGMEAEIIGALEFRPWRLSSTGECGQSMAYRVRWADGHESIQEPHYLRRRKPPTTGEQSILALFKGVPQHEKEPA